MRETPRTDANQYRERVGGEASDSFYVVPVGFARDLERELADATSRLSDSPTWIATDGYDPERPKDGEKVLGWWPKNSVFEGGMESLTFHAADEDGRSDTWTNAFGDSADAPDYWARVKGPK